MILIGLCGKKQSGKDTVAKMITDILCLPYQRIAFADSLKEEVASALQITVSDINADKEFYRPLLQWWGTEYRRGKLSPDYWIKRYLHKLRDTSACVVVTPDVRFHNEAQVIKEVGGKLLRVNRMFGSQADKHSSETSMDFFPSSMIDFTVDNNSSIEQLKDKIIPICLYLKEQLHLPNSLKLD